MSARDRVLVPIFRALTRVGYTTRRERHRALLDMLGHVSTMGQYVVSAMECARIAWDGEEVDPRARDLLVAMLKAHDDLCELIGQRLEATRVDR